MFTFHFNIPHTHPSLDGHFPDEPIVAGVIIIDEVISGVNNELPKLTIDKISLVKFIKPLRPDVVVKVSLIKKKPGR